VVKLFSQRIIHIDTIAGFYPELIIGPSENINNKVVIDGRGIGGSMFENLEFITVVPVEPRQRAEPHKPLVIFKYAGNLIVRQAIVDIQPGKLKFIVLRITNAQIKN
jgi:hypothetical protein